MSLWDRLVIGPRGSAHINGRADGYDYAFFDVTIWESENRMLKSGATGDGRVRGLYKASGGKLAIPCGRCAYNYHRKGLSGVNTALEM